MQILRAVGRVNWLICFRRAIGLRRRVFVIRIMPTVICCWAICICPKVNTDLLLNNAKTKKDTYALLSLANIWLESLYTPTDAEKKKRHSERAF